MYAIYRKQVFARSLGAEEINAWQRIGICTNANSALDMIKVSLNKFRETGMIEEAGTQTFWGSNDDIARWYYRISVAETSRS
jgi:hypothetical protein